MIVSFSKNCINFVPEKIGTRPVHSQKTERAPSARKPREAERAWKQHASKIESIEGSVFTRADGRPIRDLSRAFEYALERAKLQNSRITPHSFRRACISRWTDLGIPRDFVMLFSGHKPSGVHDDYLRFTDTVLVNQFRDKGLLLPPEKRKTANAV